VNEPVFLAPWPEAPVCAGCNEPASVSRYDKALKKTVVTHEDASEPCVFDGGSGFVNLGGGTFSVPIQMTAEFADLEAAKTWAMRPGVNKAGPVYLGYVHGHDGNRKIGRLKSPENALATVVPEEFRS